MTETLVRLDHLCQQFGKELVLDSINAEVKKGDVIGLLGLNGAGKTTLLETLLGFALPSRGHSLLFGEPASQLNDQGKARIGFVPQQDELLANLTGQQNLDLLSAFYPDWDKAKVAELAKDWDIPLNKRVQALSLGQRQKLSILAALAHNPDFLILDEPVASLDPLARRRFLQTLVELIGDRGCTLIFSTHIVSDLERIADRIWILKEGRLVVDSTLDELKESALQGNGTDGFQQPKGLEEIFLELHA
ncbi:ABC transporter ATP-binding protein [Gallaecimonas kandeliae]|uniref:ABC transporter ATP-binding protein n=1 Tax=Gallaecimonas kandeliae TaxID=3029055 RepID=UPI002647B2B4|nr:ABC transporter ATP-binding protein [Gallaecimonas kandeliae]WKE66401.1 ABC transporter ATP-binding protein [Gallaecimonas kandeliae]